ncbi:hypothetical protein CAOG_007349 [Capsaspora owczarzaki ATCC 30864]|uniref:Uncharacterized protein n=1 Tax=Capsaspora owczarzaki (strain ATCC 30864) TaxID=595528 RepID=A0A0D2UR75_CAPO3|nr:hypothetical protein CAOG_007349 [Capsaspora owczarzaki ATCC 30864]
MNHCSLIQSRCRRSQCSCVVPCMKRSVLCLDGRSIAQSWHHHRRHPVPSSASTPYALLVWCKYWLFFLRSGIISGPAVREIKVGQTHHILSDLFRRQQFLLQLNVGLPNPSLVVHDSLRKKLRVLAWELLPFSCSLLLLLLQSLS